MTNTLTTRLEITSWDEKPYQEEDDGSKLTRATVVLGGADGISAAAYDAIMYYRPDGTSSYVSLMRIEGALEGRRGTFVLRGHGSYDGVTARGQSTVVEGSGTEALAGLSGSAESSSTHADYPFMPLTLTFDLE
jgi:hypothetical protein